MTILLYHLAIKNKIVLFCLQLHSIHLIQLLNIEIFQLFKQYHTDEIDRAIWLGDKRFCILEFLTASQSFCNQTFKPTTICYAFKSTGLVLSHLDVVLDKIRSAKNKPRENKLPSKLLLLFPSVTSTYPQGPASVVKYGQKLQRAYAKLKPGENIDSEQIQRFIRGSIASTYTLELTAGDLKAIQEATTAWAKRAQIRWTGCSEEWDNKSQ